MKLTFFKLILVFVFSLLLACAPSDTPEMAVKEWLQGIVDQDGLKVEDRTCSARLEELRQSGILFTALGKIGESLIGEKPKYDISGVKVNVTKSEGDIAEAKITGKIRVAIGLSVKSDELNETWRIVREGGKWKVCQSISEATSRPSPTAKTARVATQPVPTKAASILGNANTKGLIVAVGNTYTLEPDQTLAVGPDQIFTMRPDGSNLTQLTFGNNENNSPIWSPDGKKIWFISSFGKSELYMMDANGLNQTRITNTDTTLGTDESSQWSQDGQYLLYFQPVPMGVDFQVVKRDGTKIEISKAPNSNFGSRAQWLPGSNKIVFMSDGGLWLTKPDGSPAQEIVTPEGIILSYEISPDGKKIAYFSVSEGLIILNLEDGKKEAVNIILNSGGKTTVDLVTAQGKQTIDVSELWKFRAATWSPDGKTLAYIVFNLEEEELSFDLWTVQADGNNPTKITSGADYRWSLDSKSFCFTSIEDFLLRQTTSQAYKVDAIPNAQPKPISDEEFKILCVKKNGISPDGKKLIFSEEVERRPQLFVSNTDGSQRVQITNGEMGWEEPQWQP